MLTWPKTTSDTNFIGCQLFRLKTTTGARFYGGGWVGNKFCSLGRVVRYSLGYAIHVHPHHSRYLLTYTWFGPAHDEDLGAWRWGVVNFGFKPPLLLFCWKDHRDPATGKRRPTKHIFLIISSANYKVKGRKNPSIHPLNTRPFLCWMDGQEWLLNSNQTKGWCCTGLGSRKSKTKRTTEPMKAKERVLGKVSFYFSTKFYCIFTINWPSKINVWGFMLYVVWGAINRFCVSGISLWDHHAILLCRVAIQIQLLALSFMHGTSTLIELINRTEYN